MLWGRGQGGAPQRLVGYPVVQLVCSAVGECVRGCSIKAGGAPCSAPGVQCCGGGCQGVFHKG